MAEMALATQRSQAAGKDQQHKADSHRWRVLAALVLLQSVNEGSREGASQA
jgi:hypothetical protein